MRADRTRTQGPGGDPGTRKPAGADSSDTRGNQRTTIPRITFPPHPHPLPPRRGKGGSGTSETRLYRLEPRWLLEGLWRRPERQSRNLRALVRTEREILRRATRHTGRIVRARHQLIQPPLIVEENDRLAVLTLSLTWSLAVRPREWDDLGLHREVLRGYGGDRGGLRSVALYRLMQGGARVPSG